MESHVSLFVGRLPGEDTRKLVVFPNGRVVAEICDQEIESPSGEVLSDRGAGAAAELITALQGSGWYIEQMEKPSAVWLRPAPSSADPVIAISAVDVDVAGEDQLPAEGFS